MEKGETTINTKREHRILLSTDDNFASNLESLLNSGWIFDKREDVTNGTLYFLYKKVTTIECTFIASSECPKNTQ